MRIRNEAAPTASAATLHPVQNTPRTARCMARKGRQRSQSTPAGSALPEACEWLSNHRRSQFGRLPGWDCSLLTLFPRILVPTPRVRDEMPASGALPRTPGTCSISVQELYNTFPSMSSASSHFLVSSVAQASDLEHTHDRSRGPEQRQVGAEGTVAGKADQRASGYGSDACSPAVRRAGAGPALASRQTYPGVPEPLGAHRAASRSIAARTLSLRSTDPARSASAFALSNCSRAWASRPART